MGSVFRFRDGSCSTSRNGIAPPLFKGAREATPEGAPPVLDERLLLRFALVGQFLHLLVVRVAGLRHAKDRLSTSK